MNGINNSLELYKQISVALLRDVKTLHDGLIKQSELDASLGNMTSRLSEEGLGFLTETLPKLGKRLDRSLASDEPFNVEGLGFKTQADSVLPEFLGELFRRVFDSNGQVLPEPSVLSVRCLRQICFGFYKLELPYAPALKQAVIDKFVVTDQSLQQWNNTFRRIAEGFSDTYTIRTFQRSLEKELGDVQRDIEMCKRVRVIEFILDDPTMDANDSICVRLDKLLKRRKELKGQIRWVRIIRRARTLLWRVFRGFDPKDIVPSHGPGAVSTRERLWEKWKWTHVPDRVTSVYPIDEYFFVNLDHVCDRLRQLTLIGDKESPAKVCLVPKDSRGPRLISCEPLELQWLQQGLGRAVVQRVEHHTLTKYEVHFTDQGPNRARALIGSKTGRYATLDLEEASDRVSLELVRLLFPEPLLGAMEAIRSQATKLPGETVVTYQKFAPMGSALCFPVLALTIWSLLRAGFTDADHPQAALGEVPLCDTEDDLLVYGDDVIVPTAKAADAIAILEAFGLRVNVSKSCTGGRFSFRESCGMDAFRGEPVTPVRFRTAWTSTPRPEPYESYVAYANALYKLGYRHAHDVIVKLLFRTYGPLADADWQLPVPSVIGLPEEYRSWKSRWNPDLQRLERRVLRTRARAVNRPVDGWMMLLRYLTSKEVSSYSDEERNRLILGIENPERCTNDIPRRCGVPGLEDCLSDTSSPFSAQSYTKRQETVLSWCWR